MLTIQILSSALLLSASVFAQAADKPCAKAAQRKQFQKVVRESGRGNWQNWGQWATRNYTWPMATSTVNAKPVETPVELPSVAAPAEDARPTTTRAARPRPTAVKTTSVKPTSVKPTSAKPKPTSVKPTTTRKPQNTTRSSSSSTSQKPVETSPASGNLSAFAQAAVSGHNAERKLHGADPVVWDEALAKEAQKWTDRCVFEHGGGKSTGSGENLAGGASMEGAVKMWADEKKNYKQGGEFSMGTGHFTQVVWKNTKKIGCGSTKCKDMYSPFISCIYYPPGNYAGQFDDQVQAVPSS